MNNNAGQLGLDLSELLERKPKELLFDFSMVSSISAIDGSAMARHLWAARQYGAKIVLGAVRKPEIKRFLDKAGFMEYFSWEDNIPAAIGHFSSVKTNLLGQLLVSNGHVNGDQLKEALECQHNSPEPIRLGTVLQKKGFISSPTLLRALFRQKIDLLAA
jgi:anti-anti-sigma regulatory factor